MPLIVSSALITNAYKILETVSLRMAALSLLHTNAQMATATVLLSTTVERVGVMLLFNALPTNPSFALMVNVLVIANSARLKFHALLAKLDVMIEAVLIPKVNVMLNAAHQNVLFSAVPALVLRRLLNAKKVQTFAVRSCLTVALLVYVLVHLLNVTCSLQQSTHHHL